MLQVKQSAALPAPLIVALLLCALIIQTQQQIDDTTKAQRVHEPCAAATRVVNNATVETRSGKFEGRTCKYSVNNNINIYCIYNNIRIMQSISKLSFFILWPIILYKSQ